MSDQGEKTCPLCTEEMDLTDQQLRPCKCGYEICVWCWHQIMDLADKVDSEGRCPACRTPYDKEKIVGMASNCERLVADITSDKRLKSHKTKPKTAEGRKHLTSVRVIQRNLVYIMGIPSDLADEDLLQRKEYFGQYGKVQKVSIARTAAGAIQHSANNTCSVYITYSKEEEAVRCIQSMHGYVLEGKSLRACFGTTKYCHAWLRNMSCSNPYCLYLHDIGSQEDSFTKDEIISAYTRSRVQQITGATNNLQRRSGSILPPPADEFCISSSASSGKLVVRSVPNNSANHVKGSPPNGSSGRSIALPAASSWGLRVSNGRPPISSSSSACLPTKQKPGFNSSSVPAVCASVTQGSTPHIDVGKQLIENEESPSLHPNSRAGSSGPSNQYVVRDCQATISESPPEVVRVAVPGAMTSSEPLYLPASRDKDGDFTISPSITHSIELDRLSSTSAAATDVTNSETIHGLCTELSSVHIDGHLTTGNSDISSSDPVSTLPSFGNSDICSNGLVSTLPSFRTPASQGGQQYYPEHVRDALASLSSRKAVVDSDGVSVLRESVDWGLESGTPGLPSACSEEDSLALDYGGFNFSENCTSSTRVSSNYLNACSSSIPVSRNLNPEADETFWFNDSVLQIGPPHENKAASTDVDKGKYLGSFSNAKVEKTASADMGESSIISNILSMDPDVWDDSLTSPHNLVRLLNENDKQHSPLKIPSSLKAQNSNQSRFSFARQEDFMNQGPFFEASLSNFEHMTPKYTTPQDSAVNRDPYFEKLQNGISSNMFAESDPFSNSPSNAPFSKLSAPPGFSFPSRAPPPGFLSQARMDQAFEPFSGNHLLDSSFLRNQYVGHPSGSYGTIADVELIDPAILAVGKGRLPNGTNNSGLDMRSTIAPPLSTSEDPRLQMLMQLQISGHQSLRFPNYVGDRFSSLSDAYRAPSRLLEQSQGSNMLNGQFSLHQSRNPHMLNGHWNGWNEVQTGNDLGMAELLRNERLGLNKHFPGYEDRKLGMPTSGDIYSRAFGN